MTDSPIFIVGPLRSGSTLLSLILNHHSKLNIFGEFEGAVSQCVGDSWPDLESYYRFVETNRMMREFGFQIDSSLTYKELIHDFMEQLYQRSSKPFIGAAVHSRIDMLPSLWPEARFIHLYRDPRDVAVSTIGMGWVGNVYEGAEYWLTLEARRADLIEKVPEKSQTTVHFEELVAADEQVVSRLCDFLGIDFEPSMLDVHIDTSYARPDPSRASAWRHNLSSKEVGWVEGRCADKMQQQGYCLSGEPLITPNVVERIYLKLSSRAKRAIFNIRRWGLLLWLRYVLAKLLKLKTIAQRLQREVDDINKSYLK